jgi:hypothetical protein
VRPNDRSLYRKVEKLRTISVRRGSTTLRQ